MASGGWWGQPGLRAALESLGIRGTQGHRADQEILDLQENVVKLASLEPLDSLDHQMVDEDLLDPQDLQDLQGSLDLPGGLDSADFQGPLECQDPPDPPDHPRLHEISHDHPLAMIATTTKKCQAEGCQAEGSPDLSDPPDLLDPLDPLVFRGYEES